MITNNTGRKVDIAREIAEASLVATEGMNIIRGLVENNFGIAKENKQGMVQICLKCMAAHMEAFETKTPNQWIPMSMTECLRMMKLFCDADNDSLIEYARIHQDHIGDIIDSLKELAILEMSNEELAQFEQTQRKLESIEGRRM